jgi:hypothetical protein
MFTTALVATGLAILPFRFGGLQPLPQPAQPPAAAVLSLSPPARQTAPQSPQRPIEETRVIATVTVLDGTVFVANVDVELREIAGNVVLAKTMTDGTGQASFPDVPAGRYSVRATKPGFEPTESQPFDVRLGETTQVLVELGLTYVAPIVEVRAASPTQSVQPVSASDMLAGSVLGIAPLQGDDFQSLLPLLPGVVRGPDGRLRAKGGQPTQGALQISSASLIDPSTGDFDLEIPGQSLESVELLANPFAAEYGRFSTSVTQLRTKRGTNDWYIKPGNLMPRFRKNLVSVRGFEPRFSIRGPLKRDRLFIAQEFQFRYVNDPVKSLPDEPDITLRSFDSFTRIDSNLSTRHTLGGLVVMFPRRVERISMTTFRPPPVTPEFNQSGTSVGVQDRLALSPNLVLESTLAGRFFEINVNTLGDEPMRYAPETQSGRFFNDQEREVKSVQWVETLSFSLDRWRGQHLFKLGLDLQDSKYSGSSTSRPLEILRANGSLAELHVFGAPTVQDVNGTDFVFFAQDRWRASSRLTLELGLRMDRESITDRANWSPRAGVSIAVLPEGRAILRGGVGKFVQRTPLNIGAFPHFEDRSVSRFAPEGSLVFSRRLDNVSAPDLQTPEAIAGNVEWNQRFGRRVLFKANYLKREGSHEYILEPDLTRGEINLLSAGASRYWELELTGRYLGGERRDITVSYVRSHGEADLNNYDQFYGNIRTPIIRPNENNLIPTDVPHRVLIRGTIGFPGRWDLAPVIELRSGFPWSAVDEYQDFVGPRNRAGRMPTVRTFDFSISRPWHVWKFRFRAGLKVYNIFGAGAERDVQNNIASPAFGQFFNPIERSIGFVFGSGGSR